MRHGSLFGPLLLVFIGGQILWHRMNPEFHVIVWLSQYWPFLLIAWGLIRLAEVLVFYRDGNSRADAQSTAAGTWHVWRSAELGSEREIRK